MDENAKAITRALEDPERSVKAFSPGTRYSNERRASEQHDRAPREICTRFVSLIPRNRERAVRWRKMEKNKRERERERERGKEKRNREQPKHDRLSITRHF